MLRLPRKVTHELDQILRLPRNSHANRPVRERKNTVDYATPFRYQYCSDRWKYLALPATKSDTGILPNAAHDTQKMGYWLFKCCTSCDENNIKRLFDIYGIIKEAEIRKKSNKTTNSQNLRNVCLVIMLNLGVMRRWFRGAAAAH